MDERNLMDIEDTGWMEEKMDNCDIITISQ